MKKRKFVVAADWLASTDTDWWFYSLAVSLNKGCADIVLAGNGRLYSQKDRNTAVGHLLYSLKNIVFSFRLIFWCNKNDVVFCWTQLPALMIAFISRLFRLNRNIVCQNFLYRSSRSKYFDAIRISIYNYALGYKKLFVSVQGFDLLSHYKTYGLNLSNQRCYFVADCVPESRVPEHIIHEAQASEDDYIFTGGEANRDWKLVVQVAESLPHYNFKCVARKRFFDHSLTIPANVKMYWDTTLEEYFTLLARSKMSLIPIKEIYNPAGLLLLFDSITLGKLPIATATPFISVYLEDYCEHLCFRNANEAVSRLSKLYFSTDLSLLQNGLNQKVKSIIPQIFVNKHLEKLYQISDVL